MARSPISASIVASIVASIAALAACGAPREAGPAWPRPRAAETDGGESLAPRGASSIAAIEDAEDATPTAPASASGSTGPAAAPAPPGPRTERPAEPPARELEVLTTEEIVIEVDD
jgi:hypothetical protein